jgi:hypothetical protein
VNAWRKGSYLDKGGLLGVEEGGVEVLGVPVYTHNAGGGSWYSPGTCTFSLILFPLPTHLHPSDHPSPPPDTHGWVSYFTICLCRIVVEVEDKAAVERDRDLKLIRIGPLLYADITYTYLVLDSFTAFLINPFTAGWNGTTELYLNL